MAKTALDRFVDDLLTDEEPRSEPSPPQQLGSRDAYRQTAEAVADDCFAIDLLWLADAQPALWQRLKWLDFKASELERRGMTGEDYQAVLGRIVQTVKKARALCEQQEQHDDKPDS